MGTALERASAFSACLAVALTCVVASDVVKPLVGRARPSPGGQVAARTIEVPPATMPTAGPMLWGLATFIAVSRIYVGGQHASGWPWPTPLPGDPRVYGRRLGGVVLRDSPVL